MPASTTVTAVPATAVKRKQRDEEAGSDDEGSDVVCSSTTAFESHIADAFTYRAWST